MNRLLRFSRPYTIRRARRALASVLAAKRFDRIVCHAPWTLAAFGGVIRRAGLPLVFWAHDAMTGRHWTERLARRVVPDMVICNSAFTASTLVALFPGTPSEVVHPPVTPHAGSWSVDRSSIRASLATSEDAFVIVQASRSEEWKGHRVLLQALRGLADIPGWVWWQIGGAQRPAERRYLDSLREHAHQVGIAARVRWVGERDDVRRLLTAADVYCQPNVRPEPFGIVFVEALAAGLPVVTTRTGGAVEIVDHTCGLLLDGPDPAAVESALRRLIQDPALRRRLANAAVQRAARFCDRDRHAAHLWSVLAHQPESIPA